jgi:hypothetical protein
MLRRQLVRAEELVAQGRIHVARQRQIVAELERDGHALAITARAVPAEFERTQKSHVERRDTIIAEITQAAGR